MSLFDKLRKSAGSSSDDDKTVATPADNRREVERLEQAFAEGLASIDVTARQSGRSIEQTPSWSWGRCDMADIPDIWDKIVGQCVELSSEGVCRAQINIKRSTSNEPGAVLTYYPSFNFFELDLRPVIRNFADVDVSQWAVALGNQGESNGVSVSDGTSGGKSYVVLSWEGAADKIAPVPDGYAAGFEERFFAACERRYAGDGGEHQLPDYKMNQAASSRGVWEVVKKYVESYADDGYTSVKIVGLAKAKQCIEVSRYTGSGPCVYVDFYDSRQAKETLAWMKGTCEKAGFEVADSLGSKVGAFTVRWMPEEFDGVRDCYTPAVRQAYEEGVPLSDILG